MNTSNSIIDDSPLPRRPRGGRNRPIKTTDANEGLFTAAETKATIVPDPETSVATSTTEDLVVPSIAANDDGLQPLQYNLGKRKRTTSTTKVQQVSYTHPYFAHPITIASDLTPAPENSIESNTDLPDDVKERLTRLGYSHLFPVQSAVLPILIKSSFPTSPSRQRDILVSAPTGSGKTLSYAIPLVQALQSRNMVRIRALVVLPTRDLAAQVRQVFINLTKGTDVRIGLAAGGVSLYAEQASLVSYDEPDMETEISGSSKVDVLIATPGRLVDHIRMTPGFSLHHLRYLVIDEADKLLGSGYQGWVAAVLQAIQPEDAADGFMNGDTIASCDSVDWTGLGKLGWKLDEFGVPCHQTHVVRHSVLPSKAYFPHHAVPLQKLLFSATLTQNPAKLAALKLYHPVYVAVKPVDDSLKRHPASIVDSVSIDVDEQQEHDKDPSYTVPASMIDATVKRFTVPSTLTEHLLVVPDEYSKPLAVIYLLYIMQLPSVLIFCKSIDSTHRLATFLNIYANLVSRQQQHANDETTPKRPIRAIMLTSDLPRRERKQVLEQFRKGDIHVLVASDLLTRGTDLGSVIKTVISYDVPASAKTYIHRIGRTARAGAAGSGYVLALPNQARYVKSVLAEVGREGKFKRDKWDAQAVAAIMDLYKEALVGLGHVVHGDAESNIISSRESNKNQDLEGRQADKTTADVKVADVNAKADSTDDSSDGDIRHGEDEGLVNGEGDEPLELIVTGASRTIYEDLKSDLWSHVGNRVEDLLSKALR